MGNLSRCLKNIPNLLIYSHSFVDDHVMIRSVEAESSSLNEPSYCSKHTRCQDYKYTMLKNVSCNEGPEQMQINTPLSNLYS